MALFKVVLTKEYDLDRLVLHYLEIKFTNKNY
jgi:hypothetical protein